jgi:hypothetical protein
MVATMVLRQCGDRRLSGNNALGEFRARDGNVAAEFFDRCTNAIGQRPFGTADGLMLGDLARRIERLEPHAYAPANEA